MVTAMLQHETSSIPVVFVFVGDPVGSGFVASLAKPGGNLTGFALFKPAIGGKWLQVLAEIAPHIKHVAFLLHAGTPANVNMLHAAEAAAPALGVKLSPFGIQKLSKSTVLLPHLRRRPMAVWLLPRTLML
jgi:putative ABC transport system substrate-binding protein